LFFSEQALCQAYLALSTTRKDGFNRRKLKCSYSNHQWELGYINHMTIRKAECILKQVDFQLKYLKLIPLRKMMTPLVKHKLLREFFTHSVAIVLKKGEKEDES